MIAIILAIFTCLLLYLYTKLDSIQKFWKVRQICLREFKKVRGPPSVPILGTAYYFKKDPVELGRQGHEWTQEYGFGADSCGIIKFWLGPIPVVGIVHGDVAKLVYDSSENITKSSLYNKVRSWIGDGLLTSTNEKWRSRRKMLTQTFHFAVLREYTKVFATEGKILADLLQMKANGLISVDVLPYIKRCTLDIICETAMGCSIGSQRGSNDTYVNSVQRVSELIWNYETNPINWLKPLYYLTGTGFEFDHHVKLTNDFTRKVIERRKREFAENPELLNSDKKLAFLDFLIKSQNENKLSDEDIREEVDTFMFEGHDTTSSGITFVVWFLGQHPEYQAKVHEELDEIFGEDYDRLPTFEDLTKMTYLEKCIKETLRITPPVPFVSRMLTEDVVIPHPTHKTLTLPAGMTVILNQIAIMKDPRFFEKPLNFYPDHFDIERVNKREAFAYVPFSAGPRNCIGQKFAMLEEKTILSWIFRRFTVKSTSRFPEEIPIAQVVLKPVHGTWVILKNRQQL